jgi:hypothetical protein
MMSFDCYLANVAMVRYFLMHLIDENSKRLNCEWCQINFKPDNLKVLILIFNRDRHNRLLSVLNAKIP